jgi:hypothetical protein
MNGYFRFLRWDAGVQQWQLLVSYENVDIIGSPTEEQVAPVFAQFHWTNYQYTPPPAEGAYWFSDDLKIFVP